MMPPSQVSIGDRTVSYTAFVAWPIPSLIRSPIPVIHPGSFNIIGIDWIINCCHIIPHLPSKGIRKAPAGVTWSML
jgi:hypothetical protein